MSDNTLHILILGTDGKAEAQILAVYGSARVIEEFHVDNQSSPGAGSRFMRIIKVHKEIRMCLEGLVDKKTLKVPKMPVGDDLWEFGEQLFESLFVGDVRRLYDVARSEPREGPLNLIFICTIPWLSALPWEFAFDPSRRKFLVTEELHFTRNVLTAVPAKRITGRRSPLRMLVVAAQPVGTQSLSLDQEEKRIRHGFRSLIDAKLFEIDVLVETTPARLHGQIQSQQLEGKSYDIVHFIGHGDFDSKADEGKLLFHNSAGGVQEVEVRTLREILCDRGIQLVFLNACDTARDSRDRQNRGVAQSLVEGGLPAVVANQYMVLDPSAVAFAEHFYWSLANGASLGEASREARIALNYMHSRGSIDWAVPVLYAREPAYRLCAPLTATPSAPRAPAPMVAEEQARIDATAKAATKAAYAQPTIRVGVADLVRYFPDLAITLARLNEVQTQFTFELADIVAPLGVWEVNAESSQSYLYASRFAEILRDKPRELGVDYLVCITNHPMRNDEYYNIYGWWSADKKLAVLILSTADLDLPNTGPDADRAMANVLVTGLAAQMLESASSQKAIHRAGSKKCPLYFNADRSLDVLVDRLKFESRCRDKLLNHLPEEVGGKKVDRTETVEAFDEILAVFDDDPS